MRASAAFSPTVPSLPPNDELPEPALTAEAGQQALEGLRVLDLTGGIAGPLGVLQLAEHGADVIKIEPPGGRPDRTAPPSRVYNRSRRSVTIDLSDPDGIQILRELMAAADVLVESFGPGVAARLGIDYDSVSADFPRLVYCSIPAWPSGTRYEEIPGYEALVQARTGQHWESTSFRTGPVFLHSPVASMGAMFLVPIGILAALQARERTGRGQRVEVSLLQGVMSLTTQNWNWTDKGRYSLPKSHPAGIHQMSIYECADGEWVHASTQAGMTPTRSEASILGIEDVPFVELINMSPTERTAQDVEKKAAFKRQRRAELIETYHASGLGAEAIVTPHERFEHPHLRATGGVVEVDDPEVGPTTQVGVMVYLESTPGAVKGPQPVAGAHNAEVLAALGRDRAAIEDLRSRGVI